MPVTAQGQRNLLEAQDDLWEAIDDRVDAETDSEITAASVAINKKIEHLILVVTSNDIGELERAVLSDDKSTIWPNWVYEARAAIKHQNESLPWLPDLLAAMGWRGGTIHQALSCVRRVFNDREEKAQRRERDLIDALRRIETTLAPIAVAASQGGSIPAYQAHLMAREALRQTERQAANQKGQG